MKNNPANNGYILPKRGLYLYTLTADGVPVQTKRMLVE